MCGDRLDDGIIITQISHRVKPDPGRLHENLSFFLMLKGDIAGAEREGLLAVKADSESSSAWKNLGILYHLTNEHTKAIGCCERSLRIEPNNPKLRSTYAMSLILTENIAEGIEQLREALRLDPQEQSALNYKKSLRDIGIEI